MSEDLIKWIWKLFLIVIVVSALLILFYVGFNRSLDLYELEAGLLKDRIKFSLERLENVNDWKIPATYECNIPNKYGLKLIIDKENPIFINKESYFASKGLCKWRGVFCHEYEFEIRDKKVKLDVVFEKEERS